MMERARDWIGRVFEREDVATPRMIESWQASLEGSLGPGAPGLHWCLAPEILPPEGLGRDGHPAPGRFVPRTPLPRRMWAGGEVHHLGPIAAGEKVRVVSTIMDVREKPGRSGPLCFVTVERRYKVDGAPRVVERQDLVYREDQPSGVAPRPAAENPWPGSEVMRITPDATLLFRFSALTFNGHRIHYDADYAREVEGYAGLVVHGPLQAVWMMNLAARMLGAPAEAFAYRALNPLILGETALVEARRDGRTLELRVRRESDGVATMQATAAP